MKVKKVIEKILFLTYYPIKFKITDIRFWRAWKKLCKYLDDPKKKEI